MSTAQFRPVVLAILDGWGLAPPGPGNAISQAKTPNISAFWHDYLHTQLIAHGESVGLPKREPGNTETGHLNLGAGLIVYQDLPRINMSIADGSFFQNPALLGAANHARNNKSNLHLLGLIGGGGVHSDLSHFFALLRLFHEQPVPNLFLHIFTDGRDSPPTAAMIYINQLKTAMSREGIGQIASVMGRYYAMDRDFRWDRTSRAYYCLTEGKGKTAPSIEQAISQAYDTDQTDEFIEPTNLLDPSGQPTGLIHDNDAVIFVNFRIDRPRQLAKAFVLPEFEKTANIVGFDPFAIKYLKKHNADSSTAKQTPFSRPHPLKNLFFVTMTEYEKNLPVNVAYPPQAVPNPLGRIVSEYKLNQLRVSESEKERFVTYYFNGLKEDPFPGETRMIIPSPKVPTYDKKPEMSAVEITSRTLEEVKKNTYDLIIMNYANADMVGHSGNIPATVKGCEVVDQCLGQLAKGITEAGGVLLITADHGNAEEMLNLATGATDTEHNANPVPFIVIGTEFKNGLQAPQGILADVAPTLLSLLQIPLPMSMTGRNLISFPNSG
jgi:2,3-bisphosphoglycerate-independent phosphoglycerate mutase